jgi:hypothetical protein
MASSIWKGSSSSDARKQYIELASKFKQQNGSLSGFLKENGALLIDGNLYKVRVSGDRLKLANIWNYNQYQTLRSNREGYDTIRSDLKNLGVNEGEIDAFIAKDKKLYKSKVQQIGPGETKGHIQSLHSGGRDGSWNIESEPASDNFSKKSQSPSSPALLGEGVPRNTKEAFIRSKDPSGLPDPSNFSADERAELRTLKTADEVDDFLNKKYGGSTNLPGVGKVDTSPKPLSTKLKVLRNTAKGLAVAGIVGIGPLGTAASASETVTRHQIADMTQNPLDRAQAHISSFSLAADGASYAPPATFHATVASTAADILNAAIDSGRDIIDTWFSK